MSGKVEGLKMISRALGAKAPERKSDMMASFWPLHLPDVAHLVDQINAVDGVVRPARLV